MAASDINAPQESSIAQEQYQAIKRLISNYRQFGVKCTSKGGRELLFLGPEDGFIQAGMSWMMPALTETSSESNAGGCLRRKDGRISMWIWKDELPENQTSTPDKKSPQHESIQPSASITYLTYATNPPVVQPRRSGRLPQNVINFRKYSHLCPGARAIITRGPNVGTVVTIKGYGGDSDDLEIISVNKPLFLVDSTMGRKATIERKILRRVLESNLPPSGNFSWLEQVRTHRNYK